MKEVIFTILDNSPIAKAIYRMTLQGDTSCITHPGQFVNLKIEGCYLRRPISVCDLEGDVLTLIYKVVGEGTRILSKMKTGDTLPTLTGLGNGYTLSLAGDKPCLIGGGVGVPPLYLLARELVKEGKKPTVLLGFGSRDEVFYEEAFQALGLEVFVTTVDGSYGTKGFVTDVLDKVSYTHFYTCGPEAMLRAVYRATTTSGSFSFEERMGCGFGACMGCSCKTITGYKRICKEGPVMEKEDILWEN